MRHDNLVILAGLMATLVLAGCASAPERELSVQSPAYAGLPNGHDPINPDRLTTIYDGTDTKAAFEEGFTRYLERVHGRPLNQLSLSGGGQNGAFGAGFLVGWGETGRRPLFDEVGGVSTGALLSTHAFLGTPADDAVLEEMYTTVSKDDIYRDHGILAVLFGSVHALKDNSPLQELIAKYITAETLERVAAAYDDNRFLWVGTTNIDYDQTWIWDMGKIAKDGRLELYRDVLLASAAVPVIFPPVEIDGHLQVDGGARQNLVLAATSGAERPEPPLYGPGNFYVINNGKLETPPEPLREALGDIAATTITVMMNNSVNASLARIYFGVRVHGYNFNMVTIPPETAIGKDSLAFDPEQMRAAFDAGRALGKQPDPWSQTPPRMDDIATWVWDFLEEVKAK